MGLSAFCIEAKNGDTILLDAFDDSLKWQLGANLPKNLKADLVLYSHFDHDHYNPKIQSTKIHLTNKYLVGQVQSSEHNGDPFTINIIKVDGFRLAHFGDQSTPLTQGQFKQLGKIDIAIFPSPKVESSEKPEVINYAENNIKLINPKLVIWSHFIMPPNCLKIKNIKKLRTLFIDYLNKNASTNMTYNGDFSFISLCYAFENALELNKRFNGEIINSNSIVIDKLPLKTQSIILDHLLNK